MALTGRSFVREIYLPDRQRVVSVFESPESTPDFCYVEGDRIHWRPETAMGQVGRWRDLPVDGKLLFSIQGSTLYVGWHFLDGSVVQEEFALQLSPEETLRLFHETEKRKEADHARIRVALRPWYRTKYPRLRQLHAELSRTATAIQSSSASPDDCEALKESIVSLTDPGSSNTGDPILDSAVASFLRFAETISANCRGGQALVIFSLPGFLKKRWDEVEERLGQVGLRDGDA